MAALHLLLLIMLLDYLELSLEFVQLAYDAASGFSSIIVKILLLGCLH